MKGKLMVGIIILLTIIGIAVCWFWLQSIMDDYDIERAVSTTIEKIV